MFLRSATRLGKNVLFLGLLVVWVWLLTGTPARAQGDDLVNAAIKGDLHRVEKLLSKGADVNARSSRGGTALFGASFNGHLDVVQLLLAKGADVNGATRSGSRPLAVASQQGHLGVVQLLLDKGAEVNAKDSDGLTALYSASQAGQIEVVRVLLAKGADVNVKSNFGQTPLKGATIQGHTDVEALLVQAGARPDEDRAVSTAEETAQSKASPPDATVPAPNTVSALAQEKSSDAQALPQDAAPTATLLNGDLCWALQGGGIRCKGGVAKALDPNDTKPRVRTIDGKGPNEFGKRGGLGGGFDSLWNGNFKVALTAGPHTLEVSFHQTVGGTGGTTYSSSSLDVSFVAMPGHTYEVDAVAYGSNWMSPSSWHPIIVDVTDKARKQIVSDAH